MPALTINQAQSGDMVFRRYVESGSWQCPEGGAHRWVEMGKGSGVYRCSKCKQAREFQVPEYVWNDKIDALFGVSGAFDALQRCHSLP